MIITAVTMCAITSYHEARSTKFSEQINVASVIYNRAPTMDYKGVSGVVFAKRQFSSMAGFKPRQKFNSITDLLAYYKVDDLLSFTQAIQACSLARDMRANYTYFTNKNVKVNWSNGMTKTTTQSFNFYKEKESKCD